MEAILFIGLPASGKSSFYKDRFFNSHMRISLDVLKTRSREMTLLDTCLESDQRVVIDNTSPTVAERERFIRRVRQTRKRYKLVGYYFQSKVDDCLVRNRERDLPVPDVAIYAAAKKMERPSCEEGFDQLFYVRLDDGRFVVEAWSDEV